MQKEREEYRIFTKPSELHKAINMLRGMVAGVSANGSVSAEEAMELAHWCSLHANLRNRHPFDEILPIVEAAIEDGKIDEDEKADILWACDKISGGDYYDEVASSIQYLHGLVHGMLADGQLSDSEIQALKVWLDDNDFLQGTYPFDELYSLASIILADKRITEEERETLMAFLGNIVEFKDSYNLVEADFAKLREKYSVQGICAMCPEIEFEGKYFSFTGASYNGTRQQLVEMIESLGGIFRSGVSRNTDYLIVGNAGNPCWAFSCYGRKIEDAIRLRKAGEKVQIVNETDFWDAVYEIKR